MHRTVNVIQEWFYAKRDFNVWCESNDVTVSDSLISDFHKNTWIFLVVDHTTVPLSLSLIKSPDVRIETQLMCPNCQAPLHPQKRQKQNDMLRQSEDVL